MEDAELLKVFKALEIVAWELLKSSNPHQEKALKRKLEPLREVIEKLEFEGKPLNPPS